MTRRPIIPHAFLCLTFSLLALSPLPALAETIKLKQVEKVTETHTEKPEERKKIFNAETFTLDNGLEIYVVPNTRAPVVTHMIWYKVGGADELAGHSGIAHFLEHLLFKGSAQIGGPDLLPGEFSKIIRAFGGQDNAFTSHDYTAYFQSVPADKLLTVMKMEAGRMNGLKVPLAELLSERNVVLEERKQRTDNNPQTQFQEQLFNAVFAGHPYAIPVLGWESEMKQMAWPEIKAFYDQWYAPNNAVLVVSGDVSPAEVFQMAIDTYGQFPREATPERTRVQSAKADRNTTLTMEHPAIREPVIEILARVPSAHGNKPESLALEVLGEIMGGGATSRLYKALVVRRQIATDISFAYDAQAWDDSALYIMGTPAKGQTVEKLKTAIEKELRLLVEKGVTPEEVATAQARLQDQAAYALDSLTGPAMTIGRALASGATLDDIEYWPYDIATVTPAQVQAVAKKYLDPDAPSAFPPVTGLLLPESPEKAKVENTTAPSPHAPPKDTP